MHLFLSVVWGLSLQAAYPSHKCILLNYMTPNMTSWNPPNPPELN